MAVLLFFSFLSGIITILAPCIWPLLPIVLSLSAGGGRKRPLGITLGIMTSFSIFTLFISYIEKALHISPGLFRSIAVISLILLGLSMLWQDFSVKFEELVNYLLSPLRGRIKSRGTGFTAGYLMGFATGLVWAPCSGPILATIATLAATQSVDLRVIVVTLAYVSGLGIPLFIFSLAGNRIFISLGRFNKFTVRIQQAFGILVILTAVLIYTNYDKEIQLAVLKIFPSYGRFVTGIESNKDVNKGLEKLQGGRGKLSSGGPEIRGIFNWFNTDKPLTLAQLRGKVVLVDFWTYTCINCVRELPHIVEWYEKYKKYNFIVIGVHTPEFAFEKEAKNVQMAIRQFKILYPVAQDNDYITWQAFDNHYWPAIYLFDANGRLRMTHFGEGQYDETENAIRDLLRESGAVVDSQMGKHSFETPGYFITPETYLGLARMEKFNSKERPRPGAQNFTIPDLIPVNHFAYGGVWELSEESAKAGKGSRLEIRFKAKKVFLVIRPNNPGDEIRLFLDGKPINELYSGSDVTQASVVIKEERLYELVDLKGNPGVHTLGLEFQNEGILVYAFTFG